MSVQIVEIAGQKMAVLPVADYERLLDIAEEKADVAAAFDAEQRRLNGEEYIPAAMVNRILDGESALRVWREHRGLSQVELARVAGMSNVYVSDMERGKRLGSRKYWQKLSKALNVSTDDILPDA
ncbi:MAG: helix-turn-helix transcriptional regulator [Sphingomicrobium sp.]